MEQITKNVFVENGKRGCSPGFVVTSAGVVLIDTPLEAEEAKKWVREVSGRGPIRYLINTEHHFDHWLYNSYFDCEIIAQEIAWEVMSKMDLAYIRKRTKVQYQEPLMIPDDHRFRLPSLSFSEKMTIHLGGHTLQIIHSPGHTLGQAIVYIPEERVVFTGDNVFGERRTAIHEADLGKWLESLKKLEALDFDTLSPGHGKLCKKSYLATQEAIIRGLLEQSGITHGPDVSVEVRRKADPFFPTRDIGLIP